MKNFFLGALVFFGAAVFCSAAGIAEEARKGNERADMSYAFGMVIADDLLGSGLKFNYDAFIRGFREVMENEETRFTMDEAMDKIQAAFEAAHAEIWERSRVEGETFLAENSKRPGVVTTPSGLQYEVISGGSGEIPNINDVVRVHYRGTTIDGIVFDSTYENGIPIEIPLDRVIPGWSEGLRMMREGETAMLYIPPNLAYGESGAGGVIGPNAVLIFEVELQAIVRPFQEETDYFY
jgi:FKBP-type peptidyl-prolyl cis-trans isomerase